VKITNLLLADATNASADGKQNILGAGIRAVAAPGLPFVRSLHVFATAEGGKDELGRHHVKVTIVGPSRRRHVLVDSDVDFEAKPGFDERLPIALNIRLDLGRYVFQEFGIHIVRVLVDRARASYPFVVSEPDMPAESNAAGSAEV
jgi:uncharacterized protein DUF6941